MASRYTSRPLALRLSAVALVLGLALTRASAAQTPSDPVARALKSSGDEAMVEARFADALDAYTKALAVQPTPALHYNRGRALQGLGRNAEALSELRQFEREATPELRAAVPGLADLLSTVAAHVAELSVQCDLRGATLSIDGVSRPLPLSEALRFDPGTHEVVLAAPGYQPYRVKIQLLAGARRELAPALQRRDDSGLLRVRSAITGALVLVDGKALGVVPVEARLAPGPHRVELRHPDYRNATTQVVVGANERRDVTLSARKLPRFYETWWFWSAVGAVSTGAVVAVVAATSEKSPASGDIPPGRLSISLGRQ